MRAGPVISPPFYCARRSARRDGAYSLQPARRSVSYAFAVFRSVPPSQRHLDALATNDGEICGLRRSVTACEPPGPCQMTLPVGIIQGRVGDVTAVFRGMQEAPVSGVDTDMGNTLPAKAKEHQVTFGQL